MSAPGTEGSSAVGPPLEGSREEYDAIINWHRRQHALLNGRASCGDPGVYEPKPGEMVKVSREPGARFQFVKYANDSGGDYAVVLGGLHGHKLERCVTVDRIQPYHRTRRPRAVRSVTKAVTTTRNAEDDNDNDPNEA